MKVAASVLSESPRRVAGAGVGRTRKAAQSPYYVADAGDGRARKAGRASGRRLYYVAAVVIAGFFLFPILWTLWRSLQGAAAEGEVPNWSILTHLSFRNYTGLLGGSGEASLWHYASNSLIVAVGTVVGATTVAILAGYGLGRLKFRGAGAVFVLLLAPFLVPFQALLSPLFQVLAWLHLTDSLIGLVLVYCTYMLPFSVFIMRNSFAGYPGRHRRSSDH